jgi:hypothetical protein
MINPIGEATVQPYIRTSYNAEILDKEQEIQKTDKIKRQRPVEETDDGRKPEMDLQSQESVQSRNSLEDGELVVEKYDADGKLVKKIPPGFLPFGETA